MSEAFPEDVLKEAMTHLRSMEQDVEERADGTWKVKGFGVRNAIARAILAERENCALAAQRIAEAYLAASRMSLPVEPSPTIAKDRAHVAQTIAAAIRGRS